MNTSIPLPHSASDIISTTLTLTKILTLPIRNGEATWSDRIIKSFKEADKPYPLPGKFLKRAFEETLWDTANKLRVSTAEKLIEVAQP